MDLSIGMGLNYHNGFNRLYQEKAQTNNNSKNNYMKTFNRLILLIILILPELTLSQVVYTPPDDYVYEFLQRLSLKKMIDYHSEVKPIARIKIAEFLKEAS